MCFSCQSGAIWSYSLLLFDSNGSQRFEVVGILNSLGLHVGFGIAARMMGWAIYRGGEMGFRKIAQHNL